MACALTNFWQVLRVGVSAPTRQASTPLTSFRRQRASGVLSPVRADPKASVSDATEQLFDMRHDRGEMRNLAGTSALADTLADMREMLAEWEAGLVPSAAGRLAGGWAARGA